METTRLSRRDEYTDFTEFSSARQSRDSEFSGAYREGVGAAAGAVLANNTAELDEVGFDDGELGPYRQYGKRVFDVVVGALLLVSMSPLLVLVAVLASLDGGRPFFSHRRVGLGGATFMCHKFRSMVPDAERKLAEVLASDPAAAAEWARDSKLRNDPRVTPIGDFLRKSSLDELPQLVNVLRGEMSLVGPRPVTRDELARYGVHAVSYEAVRPGVTGPWQVAGRNDLSYQERVRLDVRYARDVNLRDDVVILLRTVLAVLRMTGK
jgi:lipopolysaccharide/colanic/teichoic acid biosynthesis glycosyltransferase